MLHPVLLATSRGGLLTPYATLIGLPRIQTEAPFGAIFSSHSCSPDGILAFGLMILNLVFFWLYLQQFLRYDILESGFDRCPKIDCFDIRALTI